MTAVYALALIAPSVSALIIDRGAVPFALAVSILSLTAFAVRGKPLRRARPAAAALCVVSACVRALSLGVSAMPSLGKWGALALTACCTAAALFIALGGRAAAFVPIPVVSLVFVMAALASVVSFDPGGTAHFPSPSSALTVTAAVAASLSPAAAAACEKRVYPADAAKGAAIGLFVLAAFLLFPASDVEISFVCVPVTVAQTALEFGCIINQRSREYVFSG